MTDKYLKTYKYIGAKIRERRLELNLTQEQLSEKIPKMDRSKISDMENGKEDFRFLTLLKVCDALHISIFDLLNKE
ncbi:XRE family transcriptional regulator [Elizabethkingia anophelis]|uniref:helix-turn-helix transcriptional regulator n=1 Tax=Elizabethkingia anophelis TaxID=1117645 RepID=UPI00136CCA17|nr:helix-turn-helix transcriptional regulator [Elizabethkingia anophelis]MYZ60339.1 XRE family transcriptional regulator [Elizabethkingia anophelis]